ncbi:hypothetical protein [Mycolicibacterium sp.]|uniref:hypothetical protein n=1 Tax=Mycolicibacterium sp. TaxID=2320850 RepID=UPI0037C6AAB4
MSVQKFREQPVTVHLPEPLRGPLAGYAVGVWPTLHDMKDEPIDVAAWPGEVMLGVRLYAPDVARQAAAQLLAAADIADEAAAEAACAAARPT